MKCGWTVAAMVLGFGLTSMPGISAQEEKTDVADIYKKKCAMCHKADGKGYPAMKTPDFTDKEWQASRTDEQMIEMIAKGKPPMPAFEKQLKPEEVKLLVTDVVRKFAQ
jgi:mono/diheme cytochrome c family protein